MKKSQVPFQAVYNKLFVDDIPEEISFLNQLELFLICKRFLFKKILIMPKLKHQSSMVLLLMYQLTQTKHIVCCQILRISLW